MSITDDDVLKEKKIKIQKKRSKMPRLPSHSLQVKSKALRKAIENLSRATSPVGLCLFFLLPES